MNTRRTTTWDPAQYLRFDAERLRPALDLLGRIPLESPALIADLGCGAGNVTALLAKRWRRARILGIDRSEAMLERATRAAPEVRFKRADIAQFVPEKPLSLLYSNAALQWLEDHAELLPRLFSFLSPGGFLAVQVPVADAAPFRVLQRELARTGPWAPALAGISRLHSVLAPDAYWDLLAPRAASLAIWETTYLHALAGPDAVLQWTMGTSLRPYLDALEEPARSGFVEAYRAGLRRHYPERPDGTTLLPFRRLFLLVEAPAGAVSGRLYSPERL